MIDWTEIRDGYNEKYGTRHTIKSMLQSLYEKERSLHRMGDVLGANALSISRMLRIHKITIQLRGWLRPTKLDKFKEVADYGWTNRRIAIHIGSTIPCVRYYKWLKRRGYKYGGKEKEGGNGSSIPR